MRFGAIVSAAVLATGLLIQPAPGQAQTSDQKAIIVLDASGSMWGRVEGKTKIEVARGVISNLLKDWDPKVQLGIVAYGHRQKGNCGDIQTLIPVGRVNSNRIMSKVNGLNPKGKTPLSQAVRQAAQALRFTEDKATVILVSDGRETCNADPCGVARDLEKAGVDFTVHVVGFDIKEQEKAQLQCMADNTGGKFLLAKNAAELNKAMMETVQLVAKPAPKPQPKVQPGLKLVTVLAEGGEPIKKNLAYTVYAPEADINGKRKRITYSYDAQPLFKLPGGKYYITVKHGRAQAVVEPELKAGEQLKLTVVLNAGYLRVTSIPTEGAKPLAKNLANTVFEAEADLNGKRKQLSYSYDAKPLFRLNAGKYMLVSKHGSASTRTEVEVTAGKLNDVTVNLNVGYLRITSVPTEGAKPLSQKLANTIFEAEADLNGRRKQITYSYDAKPLFRLGAGKYRLITKHGSGERRHRRRDYRREADREDRQPEGRLSPHGQCRRGGRPAGKGQAGLHRFRGGAGSRGQAQADHLQLRRKALVQAAGGQIPRDHQARIGPKGVRGRGQGGQADPVNGQFERRVSQAYRGRQGRRSAADPGCPVYRL